MLPNTFARIIEFVQLFTVNCNESHNFAHVMRVHDMALQISTTDTRMVNLDIIKISALMHGMNNQLVTKKLIEFGVTSTMTLQVVNTIKYVPWMYEEILGRTHEYKAALHIPEIQIVQDAVRLDMLGAIGVTRAIIYNTKKSLQMQSTLRYFHNKLYKIPNTMKTIHGKKIALERIEFIKLFEKIYLRETILQ